MRKVRTIIAALLVAVFVLGALNVSVAGQRDRLRQKVRVLSERVSALEARTSAPFIIDPSRIQTDQCADGQPAVWRQIGTGNWTRVRLSC